MRLKNQTIHNVNLQLMGPSETVLEIPPDSPASQEPNIVWLAGGRAAGGAELK